MLVVMNANATEGEVAGVVRVIEALGLRAHVMPGANRTAIGITGNKGVISLQHFENLPGVAEAIRVTKPYKLITLDLKQERTIVDVGGEIVRASKLMHGKSSAISHKGTGVFENLAKPFKATRYHSLVIKRETFPQTLTITAESDDGEIMGLQHRELPIHGVQFHPESILTEEGRKLLANFLRLQQV
jgi:hypothetical protein